MPRRPPTSVILVAAVVLLVVCALVVILGGNKQGASGEKPAFNPSYAPDTQPNSPTGHEDVPLPLLIPLENAKNHLIAGRYVEAEREFQTLTGRFPKQPEGPYYAGLLAVCRGNLDGALGCFDEAVRRSPGHQASLIERASILMDREEFAAAESDLSALEKSNPDAPSTCYLRAIFCVLRGRSLVRNAMLSPPEKGQTLAKEGVKSLERALVMLNALAEKKSCPTEFAYLAATEAATGASSQAEDFYTGAREKFLEMLSNSEKYPAAVMPRIYCGLGVTWAAGGKATDALDCFERAASYEASLDKIMADLHVLTIDKLLARRAIADSMRNIALLHIGTFENYRAAEHYIRKYLAFRPEAADSEEMQSRLYDCELFQMIGRELSFEECRACLQHPYYKIRLAGLAALAKSDEPLCDAAIVGCLKDPHSSVLLYALQLVRERRLSYAIDGVAALLKHKDINVSMEAATCAGALKAESAVPALIEALSDERASMREAAINALTDITARTMWYHFDDPPEKRAEAIEKWRKWRQEQKNSENPENERH